MEETELAQDVIQMIDWAGEWVLLVCTSHPAHTCACLWHCNTGQQLQHFKTSMKRVIVELTTHLHATKNVAHEMRDRNGLAYDNLTKRMVKTVVRCIAVISPTVPIVQTLQQLIRNIVLCHLPRRRFSQHR